MGLKVILVDDHDLSLNSMHNFLMSIGFDVQAFTSPLEALNASRDNNYDLIVSDFHMPHMNGIKLIRDIRTHLPLIKSILVTGSSSDQTVINAQQAGIDHFFPKPIQITEFMRVINEMIPDSKINKYL